MSDADHEDVDAQMQGRLQLLGRGRFRGLLSVGENHDRSGPIGDLRQLGLEFLPQCLALNQGSTAAAATGPSAPSAMMAESWKPEVPSRAWIASAGTNDRAASPVAPIARAAALRASK